MSTRYSAMLAAMAAALATINPDRVVTRRWRDFDHQTESDLRKGIFIVRPASIGPYPYETSDNGGATDDLRATQHGRVQLTIVGQIYLGEQANGEDVDAAEFALIHELETLADQLMEDDKLVAVVLKTVQMSQQIECPYAWVHTTWEEVSL